MRKEVISMVALHEGFKSRLYKCPAGKNTIGYGFNLDAIAMPTTIADSWLNILLDETESSLRKNLKFYDALNDTRKAVLIDMAYNLGIAGLLGFKDMLLALSDKRFDKAADEMIASDWAHELKRRSSELASMMRTGGS